MGLRARFTMWFGIAALLTIAAAAGITRQVVASHRRAEFARELASAEESARRAVRAASESVERSVESLATREHPFVGGLLVELLKGDGEISATARLELKQRGPATMKAAGLDAMTLVGAGDTVLAAPHFPPRVDERDAHPRRLARREGRAVVAWEETLRRGKVQRVLVLQAARTVEDRAASVTVLGGRELGAELLAALHRDGAVEARLLEAAGDRELASTEADWSRLARAPSVEVPLPGEAGRPVARLVVAVPDDDLRRTLRDVTLASAVLGILALVAALALGALVSRRIMRDLDALVAGAQAVSRGDLEHQVQVRARDEIGELAADFNAMTRELRESKGRLVQAERIAAWQDIARSLAHEIKNPLTPIQMSVETLRKAWRAKHPSFDEIFAESTVTVLEEVGRLKRIVSEFSQFARMPKPTRQACDLHEIVAGALALYRGSVKVVQELADDLPAVEADRDQLTQVVLNLLENARDAIAAKGSHESVGRITVRTRAQGDRVELEVEDNGPGFDPAFREKLFTPYFTTKEKGTGLGLAIAARIAAEHGGRIVAASAPGKGARFVVELPASPAVAAPAAPDA